MRSIWRLRSAGRTEDVRAGEPETDGVSWDFLVPVVFGLVVGGIVWFAMGAYEGGHDLATGITFGVGAWLFGRWLLRH
jgi:hypothetical protein